MEECSSAATNNDSPIDLLQDAQTPHSLQNPPPRLPSSSTPSSSIDLSQLSPQEAANHLFCNSEILAPMVRASTIPLRTLALSHGASLVYTEELVDRSITPTERIINKELGTIDYRVPRHTYSKKVQKRMAADKDNPDSKDGAILLRIDPLIERDKLIYQIGTGESNLALEAATKVINDVSGMDVNMGCPKKFSVSGGMGSALLGDVKRACDIISSLRRNLSKPVSAKIRLLDEEDPRPTIDFVRALIKAGANAITIHGRVVEDESHTMARWSTLVEVVRQLKQTESSVPIIVNGDLYTRADIREMKRRTGCDGVMLARPALYNISLFRKGKGEEDGSAPPANDEQKDEIPLSQFQRTEHTGYYGYNSPLLHSQTSIVQEYIRHGVRYRAHSKNVKYVVCEMMNSRRAPTNRVPFLDMGFKGGQTIANVCKCKSLDDLVKVWDVKWTVPAPSANTDNTVQSTDGGRRKDAETPGDLHNYDDRYFLDPDNFRAERKDAVAAVLGSSNSSNLNGDEKKTEDGCEADINSRDSTGISLPATKRTKL
mmetsp:Transcript_9075/g.20507  ORF Transcript_9075/g.20507 Transcript_9075/m.20507 type:complete len:543 (-) Transcript_9075:138-1766(-)